MLALLIFLLIIFIGIPLFISFIFYRLAKKYYSSKALSIGLITFLTPYIILAILFYIGKNPDVDFYKDEFQTITQIQVPKDAKFIHKKASYPDFQGEYSSSASITLNSSDFTKLLSSIRKSIKLTKQIEVTSDPYNWVREKSGNEEYIYYSSSNIGSNYHFIGFCKDQKTVIIHLVNW